MTRWIAKIAGIAKIYFRVSSDCEFFNFGNYPILAILGIRVDLTLLSAVQ
jgi:hypothetical protein